MHAKSERRISNRSDCEWLYYPLLTFRDNINSQKMKKNVKESLQKRGSKTTLYLIIEFMIQLMYGLLDQKTLVLSSSG